RTDPHLVRADSRRPQPAVSGRRVDWSQPAVPDGESVRKLRRGVPETAPAARSDTQDAGSERMAMPYGNTADVPAEARFHHRARRAAVCCGRKVEADRRC